jgi:hypothetical protein
VYEEEWTFVAEETDCRAECLRDFNEPSGPTFALPACPMPSDCYNNMLLDSLFNHIAECTNLRAKMHLENIPTKNDYSWREVESWRSVAQGIVLHMFITNVVSSSY